ncbi:hypothetical protein PFMALIP_02953 [Plasmodium falciparum MaliPS096_E11]|uniref:Uncharacterized protein n=1 Tax=Plasmodium falciparum MaliPS096_E11 TaxID=1036727 RepID=A0A024WR62_PLAFA|nr:hypothetical protein PFMALIP_02953 [Plasmodium falciparum MaliPS096_E11]
MNHKNNIYDILRQEDKIKRKTKQLKEDQKKKENEKKDFSTFSFDVRKEIYKHIMNKKKNYINKAYHPQILISTPHGLI